MRASVAGLLLLLATPLAPSALAQTRATPPIAVAPPQAVIVTPPTATQSDAVSRVWVLPGMEAYGEDQSFACAIVTNLGQRAARVRLRAVSQNGRTDRTIDASLAFRDLGSGQQSYACLGLNNDVAIPADMRGFFFVVSASEPVIAHALYGSSSNPPLDADITISTTSYRVAGIAIDCARPLGVEAVCAVASGADRGESVIVRPR